MNRDRQSQDELALLEHIEEITSGPSGERYGCRPPPSLARARLQRKGLIRRFEALPGKSGHINRWGLTDAGRTLLETSRKDFSE